MNQKDLPCKLLVGLLDFITVVLPPPPPPPRSKAILFFVVGSHEAILKDGLGCLSRLCEPSHRKIGIDLLWVGSSFRSTPQGDMPRCAFYQIKKRLPSSSARQHRRLDAFGGFSEHGSELPGCRDFLGQPCYIEHPPTDDWMGI